MAIIDNIRDFPALQVRGKIGKPNGVGEHILGWTELGDIFRPAGIYHTRRRGKRRPQGDTSILGIMRLGNNYLGIKTQYRINRDAGRQMSVKMKHYVPTNPRTTKQQTWRDNFRQGVTMWHSLTTKDKEHYNKLRYPERQSGFSRFMSRYLGKRL